MCGRVGRQKEADRQHRRRTGSSLRAMVRPEAGKWYDGDSGDVWERSRQQLAPHRGPPLELLLQPLHG